MELADILQEAVAPASVGAFAKRTQKKRQTQSEQPSAPSAPSAAPPAPAPSAPSAPASSSAAAPPITRSVTTRHRTGTEVKIQVHDYGELVYYPKQNRIDAFCRNPTHMESACRRSRTLKASDSVNREGQGRPLGLLVAWLRKGTSCESQHFHTRHCIVSFAERKAAREWFSQLAGSESFTSVERARREGESEEPLDIS